jgi:hypothetical protein
LVPTDRPIVQRTFLKGVGTHAILVGFPGGINLAYDGERAEPRLVWRGRFFDAYNTWFSRFAPFEKPLEKNTYRFGEAADGKRFLGYRLDPAGNPTFMFRSGDRIFTEKFSVKAGQLLRTISPNDQGDPDFKHPQGLEVDEGSIGIPGNFNLSYSWPK